MKSLKQVWATAQRNLIAKRKYPGIGEEPKATITILIHFDRTLLLIPTGCALRWAQKDEGEIQGRLSNQVQHLERNSIGDSQPRHLRGRLLSRVSTSSRRCLETERKSQPLGKKKRSRPLAFSLEPRSHGEEG